MISDLQQEDLEHNHKLAASLHLINFKVPVFWVSTVNPTLNLNPLKPKFMESQSTFKKLLSWFGNGTASILKKFQRADIKTKLFLISSLAAVGGFAYYYYSSIAKTGKKPDQGEEAQEELVEE